MMPSNTDITTNPPLDKAIAEAASGRALTADEAWALVGADEGALSAMCEAAAAMRDLGKGRNVSFSPRCLFR